MKLLGERKVTNHVMDWDITEEEIKCYRAYYQKNATVVEKQQVEVEWALCDMLKKFVESHKDLVNDLPPASSGTPMPKCKPPKKTECKCSPCKCKLKDTRMHHTSMYNVDNPPPSGCGY